MTLPSSPMRRTFLALGFITVLPIDTCPSPAMTVLPPFFTPRIVVPCQLSKSPSPNSFRRRGGRRRGRLQVEREIERFVENCTIDLVVAGERPEAQVHACATQFAHDGLAGIVERQDMVAPAVGDEYPLPGTCS